LWRRRDGVSKTHVHLEGQPGGVEPRLQADADTPS
jgi:hypothetical protein